MVIENYLKGYFVDRQAGLENLNSVEELYSKCKSINSKFTEVDLEGHSFESHAD